MSFSLTLFISHSLLLPSAALRLAIARNDTTIRNALEEFRDDSSESNLSATLRRISRQTIDDTMEERDAGQHRSQVRKGGSESEGGRMEIEWVSVNEWGGRGIIDSFDTK